MKTHYQLRTMDTLTKVSTRGSLVEEWQLTGKVVYRNGRWEHQRPYCLGFEIKRSRIIDSEIES